MNTKNNKRRQGTLQRIDDAFLEFLETRELSKITVSDICKSAGINRSTFYDYYPDVYDLADRLRERLEARVAELYREEHETQTNTSDYLKLFKNIYENQKFYKTYFKLGYDGTKRNFIYDVNIAERHFDNRFVDYHIEFFRQGLNAIIKKWLNGGCKETPEEMMEIIQSEYSGREG